MQWRRLEGTDKSKDKIKASVSGTSLGVSLKISAMGTESGPQAKDLS